MSMSIDDDNIYRTADASLAAYLYYSEIPLLRIDFQNGQGLFVFEIPPDHKLIYEWNSGRAMGNLILYYRAYRHCIKVVQDAKRRHGRT